LKKKIPANDCTRSGEWPVSDALIDNTTDMQSVSRTRKKSAHIAQISPQVTSHSADGARMAGALAHGKPGAGGAKGAPLAGKARAGRETAALGINAKLRAPHENPMVRRVERFALQSVARDILPTSRTAKCLRIRAYDNDVQVWKSKNHKTASYGGLQTCGSVWVCPVCGAKVVERRRGEIQQAMAMHRACGGEVHLLTLTAPHTRFDALDGLLERQGKALQGFLRDKTVKNVFKEMGYIGQIRGYEVTHGRKGTNNGWHPHFHFLQFVMVKGDAAQLMDWKTRLYLRWDAYCQKAGLGSPSFQHGIDLRDGSFANNYVAKWGLEDEMTKGHIKKGKAGGETPFDLLRAVLADKEDKQAAALFAEFAKAFKGKRQLSWSNGLKAKFNLVEKNDEELAKELEDNAELLGLISPDEWRDVLKVKARATVLELAAAAGWPAVKKFLAFIDGCRDGVYQYDESMVAEVRLLILEGMT
jgi:hypothetical protein